MPWKLLRSALLCLAFLPFVLAGTPARAQNVDRTTGRAAVTGSARTELTSKPVGVGTCAVLWDLTHGVYLGYEPAGWYSQLVAFLASNGISVTTTAAGLDNVDLSPYNVIVVCDGSAWDSPYTPSEVAAIQAFQAGGGGLLVMGDNSASNNGNVNPVSVPLGTTCGLSEIIPLDLYINNFIPHVIFSGINQIYMRAAGGLGVAPPSIPAALEPGGETVVSVVDAPRTVVTGDNNLWDDFYTLVDNQKFALNVFNWLCQPGPTPARTRTWGQLKTLYR